MSAIDTNRFSFAPGEILRAPSPRGKGRRRDAREVATVLLPPDTGSHATSHSGRDCLSPAGGNGGHNCFDGGSRPGRLPLCHASSDGVGQLLRTSPIVENIGDCLLQEQQHDLTAPRVA